PRRRRGGPAPPICPGGSPHPPARLSRPRRGPAGAAANAGRGWGAGGGRASRGEPGAVSARRWRESAFVPIVTPSLVQLRAELQRQAEAKA
ncbi:hypothetical protein CDO47_27750, partial [Pseudomonas aeruginosa]